MSKPVKQASSYRWPIIIVCLLATHVGAMLAVVRIATNDKAIGVVDDYYKKALDWDKTQHHATLPDSGVGAAVNVAPAKH